MPGEVWTEGWLRDGTHFRVVGGDPYVGPGILEIDGEVPELRSRIRRLRDGGTTIIETVDGTFTAKRRIGERAADYWLPRGASTSEELRRTDPKGARF